MLKIRKWMAGGAVVLLLLALAPLALAQDAGPLIEVTDQDVLEDNTLVVDRVVSDGPGWLVIHLDDNGSPGEVIGSAEVPDGESMDVEVPLSIPDEIAQDLGEDQTLHAMLHTREEGDTEFVLEDDPAQMGADGQPVIETFILRGLLEVEAVEATATPAEALPEAGGSFVPGVWTGFVLLLVGAAALAASLGLAVARRR